MYTERQPELLESFLMDAWDTLHSFNQAVGTLDIVPEEASLKDIGIFAHRLKGTAALYNYPQISKIAELVEQLIQRLPQVTPEHLPDLKMFFEQVAVCVNGSLERVSAGGAEGELGLELTALGGAQLLATLLQNSGAFNQQSTAQTTPTVAPLYGGVTKSLRAAYQLNKDDWEFFEPEAQEHIELIEQTLDAVDASGPSDAHITALFRATHTLKGAAFMMGFNLMGEVAHALEDLMVEVRDNGRTLDSPIRAALYKGNKILHHMLDAATGQATPVEMLLGELESDLERLLDKPIILVPRTVAPESEAASLTQALRQFYTANQDVWSYFEPETAEHLEIIDMYLEATTPEDIPDDAMLGELLRACYTLKGAAQMIGFDTFATLAESLERLLIDVREADVNFSEIRDYLSRGAKVLALMLRTAEGQGGQLDDFQTLQNDLSSYFGSEKQQDTPSEQTRNRAATTIRVSLDKLEALMNLAGEVVTLRGRLAEHVEQMQDVHQLLDSSRNRMLRTVSEFETRFMNPQRAQESPRGTPVAASTHQGRGIATSLQETFAELEFDTYNDLNILARSVAEMANDIREIQGQIGDLTGVLTTETEALRKLSRELRNEVSQARMVPIRQLFGRLKRLLKGSEDKSYHLITSGEGVEIDSAILEEVLEPLLHLVRNAATHGIESADERLAAGKRAEGTIVLRALHQGNSIFIEVEDDGQGIDIAQVKAQAVLRGFRTQAEVDAMSYEEACQLIFIPGLSTARTLTTEAGRGVGMDAVAESIRRLSGELYLESEPGLGSRFSIKLPLTLIVSEALMVGCAGMQYAFPANTIETLLFTRPDAVTEQDGVREFMFEGQALPYFDLAEQLGLGVVPVRSERVIAILKAGTGLIAVEVDELFELEEVVVRGLERAVATLPFLAGATIGAGGEVILILDPLGVARLSQQGSGRLKTRQLTAPEVAGRLLLVDDSVSVRRIVSKLLGRANYEVVTAGDGQAAFELMMAGERFDAILTDLEMPLMSGYELLEVLRHRLDTANLPIIVMTSRAGDKHRSLAFEIGASDYLVKPIDESQLLNSLKRQLEYTKVTATPPSEANSGA
jgi:chemosensory pili system protein ChpA (sensor histidine kinase/response regulator)